MAALGLLFSVLLLSGRADGHAIVTEAIPAANSSIIGPNVKISLRFNARIDHKRSRLVLVLPSGVLEPLPVAVEASPEMLVAEGKGLSAGSYKLRWQVLANDGHITRGEIPFDVRAH